MHDGRQACLAWKDALLTCFTGAAAGYRLAITISFHKLLTYSLLLRILAFSVLNSPRLREEGGRGGRQALYLQRVAHAYLYH